MLIIFRYPLERTSVLNQQHQVNEVPDVRVVVTRSLVPSNTIDPPLALLYVGPFTRVPLFPLPLKSVQVVPLPG